MRFVQRMPSSDLEVNQRVHVDYDRLIRAIREAADGQSQTLSQGLVLAEIRACRAQIARPIDPADIRTPNSEDRARISGLGEITITLSPDSLSSSNVQPSQIRIGPDLVSVAFALSDELHINEFDAAVLLSDARLRAAVRPDRDVVAAAKELVVVRRCNSLLYLQSIIRSALVTPKPDHFSDQSFLTVLKRERDLLIVEHSVFPNLVNRIRLGWEAASAQPSSPKSTNRLLPCESVMLAETIFLLAYTVQLSRDEAVMLRALLKDAERVYDAMLQQNRALSRPSRAIGVNIDASLEEVIDSEITTPELVEAESVRNLLLLSWMTALDRSRYQNIYDPRTGREDVNQLLKDAVFIPMTTDVPKLESDDELKIRIPKALAAAEITGAIFRLAVADPNEADAVTTFLRHSAYDGALSFLADTLASWIELRAGSLSEDADLYADVLEDLANDIAEAPHVLTPIVQFVTFDIQYAAATTANPSQESTASLPFPGNSPFAPLGLPNHPSTPGSRKAKTSSGVSSGLGQFPTIAGQKGLPPLPPGGRHSRPQPGVDLGRRAVDTKRSSFGNASLPIAEDELQPPPISENVLASLSRFVARAVTLAPSKLKNTPASGGLRYWSSVGPANWGFMQRIGDTLMDLWDVAMRNPHAPGGVGDAFREALKGFLELLASTCCNRESPLHAIAALRFLSEGGHSVVSLEQLTRGLSHIRARFSEMSYDYDARIDDTDFEVIYGIVNVIALAADALSDHGGIMAILGERGKEIAGSVGGLAVYSVQHPLKDVLIKCLGALGDRRSIGKFLDKSSKDNALRLRMYFQNHDAQSGNYGVTIRTLELASSVTSWGDEDYPERSVETIATCFAIGEVLFHWGRRKYLREAHRWQTVHLVGSLIRDIVYRKGTNSRSNILACLLTPAPGTGGACLPLKTLVSASGLIRTTDQPGAQLQDSSAALLNVSGKASLSFAAERGLGETYRMMQEAVRSSCRVLSLLLELGPWQLSLPKMSVVPASELLEGELPFICITSSLVFHVDSYVLRIMRAGYSSSVCAAVVSMLARAAHQSTTVASIFANQVASVDRTATEFRTSLGLLISRNDPLPFPVNQGSQDQTYTIHSKSYPDMVLMQGALSLVEACLGADGSSKPGLFLLGLNLDPTNRYEFASYGVLCALVELVANPSNGDNRFDSQNRAEAAMFLDRLATNTVRSTSLAVLDHLRDICLMDDNVRGSGFADEMLFRITDQLRSVEPQTESNMVDWNALALLVSSCLSLSALHVKVFPDHERRQPFHVSPGVLDKRPDEILRLPDKSQPPSPLELLRVIQTIASGDLANSAFSCFKNWYLMFGARLSVHEKNKGYNSVPLLFEIAINVLESLSDPAVGNDLSGMVKNDGGELAAHVVLLCVERIETCNFGNIANGETIFSELQCVTLATGLIRALKEVSGVSSSSSSARTALYASIIICVKLAERHGFQDNLGQAFANRIGQGTGTNVVVSSACSDVIGTSVGAKTTALAVLCVVVRLDGSRSMSSLETHHRMRKVIQVCLGESTIIECIVNACSYNRTEGQDRFVKESAVVAIAEACMAFIHAISGSGHGVRLVSESGCIDALCAVFTAVASVEVGDPAQVDPSSVTLPGSDEGTFISGGAGQSTKLRRLLLNRASGALAAATACTGITVDSVVGFPLNGDRSVIPVLLRKFCNGGLQELETISNVAMFLSRLPDSIVAGTESGSRVGSQLGNMLGSIIPPESRGMELGTSRSLLSVGVALKEISSTSEARRVGVPHPEGGSLYERDLIELRAKCCGSIFAAVRSEKRALYLFAPILDEGAHGANIRNQELWSRMDGKRFAEGQAKGTLNDILRICTVMIEEAERTVKECKRLETRSTSVVGGGNIQAISEIANYCAEEHGIEEENLNPRLAASCLKDAQAACTRHGCICISVIESALLILREFLIIAREIVRGRPVQQMHNFPSESRETDAPGMEKFTVGQADLLLRNGVQTLVPLCNHIEGLPDEVWFHKSSSFSKQVCRQIRTACSDVGAG